MGGKSKVITLDVGGQHFITSKSTLSKDPHSLLAHIVRYDLETDDSTFIDRDGTHFRYILNFLRDGTRVPPSNPDHLKELQKEAEYFQVPQ